MADDSFHDAHIPQEYHFDSGPLQGIENGAEIHMAASGSKPLGYIQADFVTAGKKVANIDTLVVLPEARGRKIGEKLLLAALEKAAAKDCKEVTLQVEEGNAGAERLYEKYGFQPSKMLVGYFPQIDGTTVDGKELRLKLNSEARNLLVQRRQELDVFKSSRFPGQYYAIAA